MADFMTAIGGFFKTYLIQICTLIVGGMLVYELYTGDAVAGARSITRVRNPIRYWFWVLFHAAIVAVLVFAWAIGVKID
jgi:hypothetical protein